MSWVFLTNSHAWKLKKPVRFDHLDFSTPEARRRDCEEEIRLNRRLARDVYQAVVPLTLGQGSALQLGKLGIPVDWLVRMRRLPADRMLDQAIPDRSVSAEDLRKLGTVLAKFYSKAAPIPMTGAEYRARLTKELQASHAELTNTEHGLPDDLAIIVVRALEFLEQNPELFDERARSGKIIEAHGDLRPEHICLERRPVIIDCLEFNRNLRILDPASELTFLALECERLGASHMGELILNSYRDHTGDAPSERLLEFYRTYHACIRARIAVWHLKDHDDVAKWMGKAKQYLQMAA
jgi:aminoglycoside phosphotransferase family enzyme